MTRQSPHTLSRLRTPSRPDATDDPLDTFRLWWLHALTALERIRDDIDRLYPVVRDPNHPLYGACDPTRLTEIGYAAGEMTNAFLSCLPPCPLAFPDPLSAARAKGGA